MFPLKSTDSLDRPLWIRFEYVRRANEAMLGYSVKICPALLRAVALDWTWDASLRPRLQDLSYCLSSMNVLPGWEEVVQIILLQILWSLLVSPLRKFDNNFLVQTNLILCLCRFLGSENQQTYFSSVQRSRVAYEILSTAMFGKKKKGEVGIDRLVEEGVFSTAFSLHDVSILDEPFYYHVHSISFH